MICFISILFIGEIYNFPYLRSPLASRKIIKHDLTIYGHLDYVDNLLNLNIRALQRPTL